MLDAVRHQSMNAAIAELPCRVDLPSGWGDFFQRRGPQVWQGDEVRRYVRSHFPMPALMELITTLPAIRREAARHVVLMKNISRQGSSFLHAGQLFPGERVTLTLPTGRLAYLVVRCIRHNESCFEVGTQLN